jgi:DNA-binding transcriptional regulator YhcF (GntR family)
MKKDIKPIEYRRYIDEQTGEAFEVPVMNHRKGRDNFEMIFYGHFLEVLNDLGNKKIQVLQYIVKNRSKSENIFIGTQRDIASALSINVMTVNKTLTILEDKGVIKTKTGVIYIDDDLICDGRFKDRIMHVYNSIDDELTVEEQKAKVEREIKRKEAELKELEKIKNGILIHQHNQVSIPLRN